MGRNVDVLMATYNGEPFLREQLHSILWQDFTDFRLVIHDDGSTDATLNEINKAVQKHAHSITLLNDGVVLRSAKKNFEHLLSSSDADYIFLADQDDVWFPTKLSSMMETLLGVEKTVGSDVPILVFSDLTPIDSLGYPRSSSMFKLENVDPSLTSLELLLSRNIIPGCSMVFNRAALTFALPFPQEAIMHDWWIALTTAATGKIVYLPKVLVLYRQHAHNTIGVKDHSLKSSAMRMLRAPSRMVTHFRNLGSITIAQSEALLRRLNERKGDKEWPGIRVVEQYLEYRHAHMTKKLRYLKIFSRDRFEIARFLLWK
ncbi:glycosyltransferase family 2 protein [Coprothermobacter platensis]|uniref:glycosyltransferase family 2 protein n=1 Tax=Coprothermobacter platensis TaxID=108819 RepID=UPI00036E03E1|nr:glycosyltransferase family 2 protein [Coprothermobacter platensis]